MNALNIQEKKLNIQEKDFNATPGERFASKLSSFGNVLYVPH